MKNGPPPPQFGVEFLEWLREVTEHVWQKVDDWSLADFAQAGMVGSRWQSGTRWTGGLDETTIDQVQARYGIRFPRQHRLFLSMLHSTAPRQRCADYAQYGDRLTLREVPGFYDWMHDEEEVRSAMAVAVDSREAIGELFADLDRHDRSQPDMPLPGLLPIHGHRYVVADEPEWVLSIVGDDVIVYGWDLRDYLLRELKDLL